MEEEKKKKRNKKKKNKQSKAAEDQITIGNGQHDYNHSDDAVKNTDVDLNRQHHPNGAEGNHVTNGQHDNYPSEVLETADENNAVQNTTVDLNRHHQPNGAEGSLVAEAEKQQWLERETNFEETIRQLRHENDLLIQNKAKLEETIRDMQNENNSHTQKESILQGTIGKLRNESDSHIQKEVSLEMKIGHLQSEKDSWLQKEASLEEKFKCLESEKDSWILKEDSTKNTIASLNADVTRLQAQVLELEKSRNNLLEENQQLMGNISALQTQIQNLERSISSSHSSDNVTKDGSELEDLDSQMEAAHALVEKLMTENAELVEKVNELYVELDGQIAAAGPSSSLPSVQMVGTAESAAAADPMFESTENFSVAVPKFESPEDVPIKDGGNGGDNVDAENVVFHNSPESDESGEIVQIPLDENEVRDLELQAAESDEKVVPITDAPLIGAPFRLISFVAKYVSGADLVNKS